MSIKRTYRTLVAGATAALLLGLTACSAAQSTNDASGDGTPASGGTLVFYDPVEYNAWKPTNSLWSNSQVSGNIAERVVWQDPETGE